MKEFQTAQQTLSFLKSLMDPDKSRTSEAGSKISQGFDPEGDRYLFDFRICTPATGWHQYDTSQDASYFGMWYNLELLSTFSFVEGDLILEESPTAEVFKTEMEAAAKYYGNPPPAFRVIDGTGHITHHYDSNARPDLSDL